MSNTWQPGPGGGEPPKVQHDFGSGTGSPDTGPHGTGQTDGGGGADGSGGVAAIADLEARLADLDARLAGLQARLAEAEDQKLRALADLDNLRKRCAVQVERAEADGRTQVARQWLPVVDNLERALEHAAAAAVARVARSGTSAAPTQPIGAAVFASSQGASLAAPEMIRRSRARVIAT